MGRNGKKKQSRPVVFARLGAEEDLQPELVRGMRSALDKLLEQLLAREAQKNGTPPPPAAVTPAVVEALASKVRVPCTGAGLIRRAGRSTVTFAAA